MDFSPSAGPHSYPSANGHTRISYGRAPNFVERIGGSLCGSIFGLALIVGSCILLYYNEGRSVHTYNMLVETRELCNPLKSPDNVYSNLDYKLVYVSGRLSTSGPVSDPDFGVSGNFVRLKRRVEMYQWEEHTETRSSAGVLFREVSSIDLSLVESFQCPMYMYREVPMYSIILFRFVLHMYVVRNCSILCYSREVKEMDGSIRKERRYTYSTGWRDTLVDSRSFDDPRYHHNPTSMPLKSTEWTADQAAIGRYELSSDAIAAMTNYKSLSPRPTVGDVRNKVEVYGDMLYSGDPHRPEVGDIRVSYTYTGSAEEGKEDTLSVVARQSPGPVLTSYTTSDGYRVLFLYQERLSMDEVFEREHASNETFTWILRGLGWLLTVVGFNLVAGILTTLVDWIPIVREVVSMSVFLLSLALGTSLSLVVMAVAWLRYHPLYGLLILLLSTSPFLVSKLLRRGGKTTERGKNS